MIIISPSTFFYNHFFCSENHFYGRKKTWSWRKQANGGWRPKRGWPMRPLYLAAWGPLFWPSWLRCRRSFFLKLPRDLKTTIYDPRAFAKENTAETQNTESEIWSWRLEGENSVERCRHGLHLLQQCLHRLHDEEGVVHPLDLGFVVVTWSNLSMYDHCWSPYDVPCMSTDLSM